MKFYCVAAQCGRPLSMADYEQNGNYCTPCCLRAARYAALKLGQRQQIDLDDLRGVNRLV